MNGPRTLPRIVLVALLLPPFTAACGSGGDEEVGTRTSTAAQALAAPAPHKDGASDAAVGSDSAQVAAVVERFHDAETRQDFDGAVMLLSPDLRVLEAGHEQDLEAFEEEHLPEDMDFAAAVRQEWSPIRVRIDGDVAWTTATNRVSGSYRGRGISAQQAELMVLRRTDDQQWRIEAIHWSSR